MLDVLLGLGARSFSSKPVESEKAFDDRWEAYFKRPDLDLWDLKKGLNEIYGHDLVPEPRIVDAALRASQRLSDVAMAIRILESVKEKAGGNQEIYNYIITNVRPTLDELGISTPEELGLDKVKQ